MNFCIDCKHYTLYGLRHTCGRATEPHRDPVTAEIMHRANDCHAMRKPGAPCGPRAFMFEAGKLKRSRGVIDT